MVCGHWPLYPIIIVNSDQEILSNLLGASLLSRLPLLRVEEVLLGPV